MLRRIESQQPVYSHWKWEGEARQSEQYLRNICRFPLIRSPSPTHSPSTSPYKYSRATSAPPQRPIHDLSDNSDDDASSPPRQLPKTAPQMADNILQQRKPAVSQQRRQSLVMYNSDVVQPIRTSLESKPTVSAASLDSVHKSRVVDVENSPFAEPQPPPGRRQSLLARHGSDARIGVQSSEFTVNPLVYGQRIILQHINSNVHLHSHGINFIHEEGSGLQEVTGFTATDLTDPNDVWIVEACSDQLSAVGSVGNNEIIRLRHEATGKYLHSDSAFKSPISMLQEVSCTMPGDDNDALDHWKMELVNAHRYVSVDDTIRLHHVASKGKLMTVCDVLLKGHSQQEITVNIGGSNDNELWKLRTPDRRTQERRQSLAQVRRQSLIDQQLLDDLRSLSKTASKPRRSSLKPEYDNISGHSALSQTTPLQSVGFALAAPVQTPEMLLASQQHTPPAEQSSLTTVTPTATSS